MAAAFGALPIVIRTVLAMGDRPPGIYRKQGDVRINGRPAQEGQPVRPGDTIESGTGSQAVFIVGRDAFLIRGDTRIETGGGDMFIDAMRVVTGKILSVFGPGARRIETPTATIGIRGTGMYIEAEPQRTYVCTCYGTAELQVKARPEIRETVATKHHEQPRYIYADNSMPVAERMGKAPVINHTDAELVMLEALVGRRPPFADAGGSTSY